MAGIWGLLSVPVLIGVLLLMGFSTDFALTKVQGVYWLMGLIVFALGICYCSILLMYLAILIIFINGSRHIP